MNAFGDAILGFSVLLVAGFWVMSAFVARSFAADRGRASAGFFLGLLYGPLGVIMALLLPSAAGSCPFCPHCRSTLSPPDPQKSL